MPINYASYENELDPRLLAHLKALEDERRLSEQENRDLSRQSAQNRFLGSLSNLAASAGSINGQQAQAKLPDYMAQSNKDARSELSERQAQRMASLGMNEKVLNHVMAQEAKKQQPRLASDWKPLGSDYTAPGGRPAFYRGSETGVELTPGTSRYQKPEQPQKSPSAPQVATGTSEPVEETPSALTNLKTSEKGRFDNVRMGVVAIQDMSDALDAGSWTVSPVGDNDFTESQRRFAEALGRLQSQGAITGKEIEDFNKMGPRITDSDAIQKRKLQNLKKEFTARMKTLGFSDEDVQKMIAEGRSGVTSTNGAAMAHDFSDVNKAIRGNRVKMSDGKEIMHVLPNDVEDARKEGFKEVP